VDRIEPQGFTKLSSLGVEQQRVNAIVRIEDPPGDLGVEFRLYARFLTGQKEDALVVPRFAVLQAPNQMFYALVVEEGKLRRREVKLGLRSDLAVEIVEGLAEDSLVVSAPDTTMREGTPARARAKE
jgi:HlyD family secretion protein